MALNYDIVISHFFRVFICLKKRVPGSGMSFLFSSIVAYYLKSKKVILLKSSW